MKMQNFFSYKLIVCAMTGTLGLAGCHVSSTSQDTLPQVSAVAAPDIPDIKFLLEKSAFPDEYTYFTFSGVDDYAVFNKTLDLFQDASKKMQVKPEKCHMLMNSGYDTVRTFLKKTVATAAMKLKNATPTPNLYVEAIIAAPVEIKKVEDMYRSGLCAHVTTFVKDYQHKGTDVHATVINAVEPALAQSPQDHTFIVSQEVTTIGVTDADNHVKTVKKYSKSGIAQTGGYTILLGQTTAKPIDDAHFRDLFTQALRRIHPTR